MKIISGGQTGADMGGLIAARELGVPTGGTAPAGWLTEAGAKKKLLRSYGLIECKEPGYPARTRKNVVESDGTLIVGNYESGGTALTVDIAKEFRKPVFLLPFSETRLDDQISKFQLWFDKENIRVLNVAGNRESISPGIAEFTRRFLNTAFPFLCRRGL